MGGGGAWASRTAKDGPCGGDETGGAFAKDTVELEEQATQADLADFGGKLVTGGSDCAKEHTVAFATKADLVDLAVTFEDTHSLLRVIASWLGMVDPAAGSDDEGVEGLDSLVVAVGKTTTSKVGALAAQVCDLRSLVSRVEGAAEENTGGIQDAGSALARLEAAFSEQAKRHEALSTRLLEEPRGTVDAPFGGAHCHPGSARRETQGVRSRDDGPTLEVLVSRFYGLHRGNGFGYGHCRRCTSVGVDRWHCNGSGGEACEARACCRGP